MSLELVDKIDQVNQAEGNIIGVVPKKTKRYKKSRIERFAFG